MRSQPAARSHAGEAPPPSTALDRHAAWIGALIVALFLAHVAFLSHVAEDSYITFRFARNLAHGLGLVWNPGEPPVEGYTNFLWLVLLAGASALHLDLPLVSQIAGTLAALGTLALVHRAGRTLCGWSPSLALLPVLLLSVCGPFARWAASGMETALFTLLVVAGACAFGAYAQRGARRELLAGAAWLTLASLARPEGVLVFAVLAAWTLLAARDRRTALRDLAPAVLLFAVLFGGYFLWRWRHFGYLLPNTFYAKTAGSWAQVGRGAFLALHFALQFVAPLALVPIVALWERGAPALSARRLLEAARREPFVGAAIALAAVYTLYVVAVGGDYMSMHRFFVPILPALYLVLARAAAPLWEAAARRPAARSVLAGLVAVIAAATAVHSTPADTRLFYKPPMEHGNYQGVQIERGHTRGLALVGRFLARRARGPGESVATNAIGVIGYTADMKVYDTLGLVDAHIAHEPPPPGFGSGWAGHERGDLAYVLTKRPTYILFPHGPRPVPEDPLRDIPPGLRAAVDRDYLVRTARLEERADGAAGWISFYERRDAAAGGAAPR